MGAILTGAGAPASGTGSDGDYYYNISSPLNLYGPKAAGAWPAAVNLLGTSGFTLSDASGTALQFIPAHNNISRINATVGADLALGVNSNDAVHMSISNVAFGLPIGGNGQPMSMRSTPLLFAAADIILSPAQQGAPILQCTGTSGNIIAPASGYYIVDNSGSTSARLIKTSTSTGVTIAASKITTVYYSAAAADFKIISVSP